MDSLFRGGTYIPPNSDTNKPRKNKEKTKLQQHLAMIAAMQKQEELEARLEEKAAKLGISVDDMGVRGGNIDRAKLRAGKAKKLRPKDCICPKCKGYFPDAKDWTRRGKCMRCAKAPKVEPAPIAPLAKCPPICRVCHKPKPNLRTIVNGVCRVCIAKSH